MSRQESGIGRANFDSYGRVLPRAVRWGPSPTVTLAPKVERVDWRLNGTPSDGAIGEVAASADTSASATP